MYGKDFYFNHRGIMSIEQLSSKFDSLRKQLDSNSLKRVRLEEKLRAATQNLQRLVAEVRNAGYDPRTMETELAAKEAELSKMIDELAEKLVAQTDAINAIDIEA